MHSARGPLRIRASMATKNTTIFLEIFGWFGMIAVLGAYALVSFGLTSGESLLFQLLNFTGSVALAIITIKKRVYQSAALNVIWGVIALVALIQIMF